MPHLCVAPEVELYYEIRHSTASSPSDQPWLLVLHPVFLDLTFALIYLDGPGQLLETFNVLLIDSRCHGRTRSKVYPTCDLWTLAADLAIVLDKLELFRVHVLASDGPSAEVSMRLDALFPGLIQSLCMCAMPPATEQGFIQTAFFTVLAAWLNPELPEDWEASVSATQWWLYGPRKHQDPHILDTWAGVMIRRYPPCKAVQSLGSVVAYTERDAPPPGLQRSITAPILVLHGDFENIYDVPTARVRFEECVNAGAGSEFKTLKGSPLQAFHTHPQFIRDAYYPWIQTQLARLKKEATPVPTRPDFRLALDRLADLLGDSSVRNRDPRASESYHALKLDKIESNTQRLEFLANTEKTKFSFVGGGAPERWTGASWAEMHPWRFSSRFNGESGSGADGDPEEIILAITESTMDEEEEEEGEEEEDYDYESSSPNGTRIYDGNEV